MVSPTILMITPWCTEYPPVYCTPPSVLHRHYAGWKLLICFRFLPAIFILWLSWKGQKFCRHWPTFRFTTLIAHAPTFSGGSRMNFPKKPKWRKTRISICLSYYRIKPPVYWTPPGVLMISPRCTEHPPVYSWYPPTLIMVNPQCTHGIPQCTEHPLVNSWYPPHSSW